MWIGRAGREAQTPPPDGRRNTGKRRRTSPKRGQRRPGKHGKPAGGRLLRPGQRLTNK
ncbi:hypothetical protein [Paenibacillus macerans]|uniref:hypothetical protein n=1 Tax=Paenibacillus macerans TaxID=44252 RepID=UPI00203A6180|nr:hypothetical protein [Paenibacillus macerans]MCM3700963.1 hypothetical protein [Paenibacillus macerans]